MPRVPSVTGETAQISAKVMADVLERRGGRLRPSDGLLLHSEAVTQGWHALFGALASGCDIDKATRELAIIRVGQMLDAKYELWAHRPAALGAGISEGMLEALAAWRASPLFSDKQRAVLAYAEAMTGDVQVKDEAFEALKAHFNDRQIVELTATIAAYNMAGRFGEALGLKP